MNFGKIGFDLVFPRENLEAALVVSLLSVFVLVAQFFYLNRFTRRYYFNIWTGAWLCYAVWLALHLSFLQVPENPWLLMLRQWCLSGTMVLLFWGSAEFLQLPSRKLVFSLFTAFLLVWSYIGAYHLEDTLQARLPVAVLLGLSSGFTGWCFYSSRRQSKLVGAGLLAFGFTLWGLHLILLPLLSQSDLLASAGFFMSAVLQLFIAVSMIVLVLEEVRVEKEQMQRRVKQATAEITIFQSQAAANQERYCRLFQIASEGIIIVDASTLRILELNQAAEQLLALKADDILDRRLPDFFLIDDTLQPLPQAGVEWFSWVNRCKLLALLRGDGSSVNVEVRGAQFEMDGKPAFQFCFHDLTERMQLEQQVRQADKLAALSRIISGVAHELNNPLAVINGYAELMLTRKDLPSRHAADVQKIARESERASKMLGRFLAFAGQHKPKLHAANLNTLVCRVAELCKYNPLAQNVAVKLDLDAVLPSVMVDEDLLQQALTNLVTNALQAMAGQAAPRQLKLGTQRLGSLVQITVEDSGPGVPEPLQAKIFDPFFTTREVGEGMGLGLSIASSIVAEHHGNLHCQRSALGGASFIFQLPLEEAAPAQTTQANAFGEQPTLPPAAAYSANVLVVDDETALAAMVGEVLKWLHHTPVICHSADEALMHLAQQHFDLILSDFHMPGANGEEFYQKLLLQKPEMTRRIIFLTGDALSDESQQFFFLTGAPYLTKPFSVNDITQAMDRLFLAQKQAA